MQIDRELAKKVLHVVDQGLVMGLGEPIPGRMCVEAAVCYAMGLPHSAEPTCVDRDLRILKIRLNDALAWESPASRAAGMRRLAIAQLGSAGVLDAKEFAKRVSEMTIRTVLADVLELESVQHPDEVHKVALMKAAKRCREEGTREAAGVAEVVARASYAASDVVDIARYSTSSTSSTTASYAASYAASRVGGEHVLVDFAEHVVQILIDMNAPGCAFLDLTE